MKNMSVGKKMLFACLCIVLLFSAALATSMLLNNTTMRQYQYFIDHPFMVTSVAKTIQTEILSIRISVKDSIIMANGQDSGPILQKIDDSKNKISSDIQVLESKYLGDPEDIAEFKREFNQWWAVSKDALDASQAGNAERASDLSINKATPYANAMLSTLDQIIDFSSDNADSFYNKASRSNTISERVSILFFALSLLLSVGLAVALTRNITRPINAMIATIKKVEAGLEVSNIETQGRRDELGKVAGAFNSMLKNLKTQSELNELKLKLEHHKTLEQFRITLMSIGDAVISTDTEGMVMNLNPVAEKMTGWKIEDARGRPIDEVFRIINAKTQKKAENPLSKVLQEGLVVGLANHTVLLSKNGEQYHIADSAAPIRDDSGHLFGVVLVFRDVSEDYRKQEEIINMSFHDKLTGLFNRAFFEEEIMRLNTARQMPLSLIMGDINGLKLINDTFGHHEGDRYLIAAAESIKSCCRTEDVIARWGGDEFVIVLPKTTAKESQKICNRIVAKYSTITGFAITPSIAIGCAVQTCVQQDYQALLKDAETNMYRHKLLESGSFRNSIVASLDNSLLERDFGTEEHAQAMVQICSDVGGQLGLSASQRDELELLARLHDIGKIAINDSILMKAEPLNPEEWEAMKRHTEIGYRIAKSIPDLEHVAEGILYHHERWDGKGYPKGLSGESIPFNARIIAVADAFDAMTRGRPYKAAINTKAAGEELKRCSGTQFDPIVVEAFLKTTGAEAS